MIFENFYKRTPTRSCSDVDDPSSSAPTNVVLKPDISIGHVLRNFDLSSKHDDFDNDGDKTTSSPKGFVVLTDRKETSRRRERRRLMRQTSSNENVVKNDDNDMTTEETKKKKPPPPPFFTMWSVRHFIKPEV